MNHRNDQSAVNNDPKLPGKYWVIQGISKVTGLRHRQQDDAIFFSQADALAEAEKMARNSPGAAFYILEAMEFITVYSPIVRTQL